MRRAVRAYASDGGVIRKVSPMTIDMTFGLTLAATAVDGLLAGASLDQSLKQLPARHRIGPVAYATYSRAADLGSGIAWYAALGVGSAVLTVAAAGAARRQRIASPRARPLYAAAVLAVLHSLVTARAAPALFGQRRVAADPAALARVFDLFARWQMLRAVLQLATFGLMLAVLVRDGDDDGRAR